jgi:HAD superfamily hydrolase (TIGR01509 family)
MRRVEALLFDFDGTLVDTESAEYHAWEQIFREHGVELTVERWSSCIGTIGGFEPLEELERAVGAIDADEVTAARRRRLYELLAREALRPGVAEYLDGAKRLGLKVGIASTSSEEWILSQLARIEHSDPFDCVVCANLDPERAKPRPTVYLEALDQLGVEPESAIAFEDSPNGVTAAKAAGIYTVAVPNRITALLDLRHADLLLESLADVPLEELLGRVRRAA